MVRANWRLGLLTSCLSALLAVIPAAGAMPSANLLKNSDFGAGPDGWTYTRNTDRCQVSFVDVVAGPYRRAMRLELSPLPGDGPTAVRLLQSLPTSLAKGDEVQLRFWARSDSSSKILAGLEEDSAPYARSAESLINLTNFWREYEVKGTARMGYAALGTRVALHCAYGAGDVEVTGLRCMRTPVELGEIVTPGSSPPAGGRPAVISTVSASTTPLPAPPDPTPAAPIVSTPAAAGTPSWNKTSGRGLVNNGDFAVPPTDTWMLYGPYVPRATIARDAIASYQRCARIQTSQKDSGVAEGAILTARRVALPLATGTVLSVRFWARSQDHCRVRIIFQQADPPHDKSMLREIRLTPDWKEYRFYSRTTRAYEPNTANFEMQVGLDKGTLDLTGVRVEDFGTEELATLEARLGAQTF